MNASVGYYDLSQVILIKTLKHWPENKNYKNWTNGTEYKGR